MDNDYDIVLILLDDFDNEVDDCLDPNNCKKSEQMLNGIHRHNLENFDEDIPGG